MKLSRVAFGLGLCALGVACSSTNDDTPRPLSSEMEQAIDTYVRLQADPITAPDGGVGNGGSGTPRAGSGNAGVGGIDPVALGSGLRAGAAGVPLGGAASGPTNAGNGGFGSPSLGGGTGGPTGAGNGGAAVGPSGVGGGSVAFAEAACYMIGNLCRYVSRCLPGRSGGDTSVCNVPSTCPSIVAQALSGVGADIPPQAATLIRCFGDGLASAPCFSSTDDLGDGLRASFGRCGISLPSGD